MIKRIKRFVLSNTTKLILLVYTLLFSPPFGNTALFYALKRENVHHASFCIHAFNR